MTSTSYSDFAIAAASLEESIPSTSSPRCLRSPNNVPLPQPTSRSRTGPVSECARRAAAAVNRT